MVSVLWMKSEASLVSSLSIDVYKEAQRRDFRKPNCIKNNPVFIFI
jgi:hypothetical protein